MTDEQRYMELLKSIGELLAKNNRVIDWQNYEIENLKSKLSDTERKLENEKKGKQDESL